MVRKSSARLSEHILREGEPMHTVLENNLNAIKLYNFSTKQFKYVQS